MGSVYLAETPYVSIQGEGSTAGEVMLFIRFAGCKTGCVYCDTTYAKKRGYSWNWERLCKVLNRNSSVNKVWITGGEPLQQLDGLDSLLGLLGSRYRKYVCTSGCNEDFWVKTWSILQEADWIVFDYKPPSAGIKVHPSWFLVEQISRSLSKELKCVVSGKEDFVDLKAFLSKFPGFLESPITVQPVYDLRTQQPKNAAIVAKGVIELQGRFPEVRMGLQMHKHIWPECFRRR